MAPYRRPRRSIPAVTPLAYILPFLLAVGSPAAIAQPDPPLAERLDAIAGAGVREHRSVGLVAAVTRGNERLLLGAYGKADVETGSAATPDTMFGIGSDTKQFTAAAVLQLRDRGKLSLDDEITKWLPDFDTRGNRITVRHLLSHTSGIVDLVEIQELRSMRLMRNPSVSRDDVYKIVSRQPLWFPTGTMEVYSNSNFWLLGLIIEKASGLSYADYVETEIFKPLGMSRSMYCSNAEDEPRRARGYGMRNGTSRRVPPILHTGTYAAGALCSTAEDLMIWLKALHGGKVLEPGTYREMITPATLADGTRLRYSMGLVVSEDRNGLAFIGHDGGGFGFSSQTRWYPAARLAVVVLTNSEPDDTTAVADSLAAAVLPPLPPARPFTGDPALLTGTYRGLGRGRDMVIQVTHTPQGLEFIVDGATHVPSPWVEGWTFRRDSALLTFRRATPDGPATELRFDRGGGHFILQRQ